MKNALIYCRVAAQNEPYSTDVLNHQEKVCLKYAKKHKFYVKNIFKEVGLGSAEQSEYIGSLIEYLKTSEIEFVLVSEYTRISRNFGKLSWLLGAFKRAGIAVVLVKDDNCLSLELGYIFREIERSERIRRTKAGIYRKRE